MDTQKEMWIIDTDPGCDDMMCLFYMLNKKDIDIKMISMVEGNTTMSNVLINIIKILKITERTDIPVFRGGLPLSCGCEHSTHVHGSDGLGNLEELVKMEVDDINIREGSSPLKIIELVEKYPNQINILAIGPLTNIALAYVLYPEIVDKVKCLYTMGGTIHNRGNIRPTSEFNYVYDFLSTSIVMNNFKKIIIVPWEPIERVIIKTNDFNLIKESILKKGCDYHYKQLKYTEQLVYNKTETGKGFMMCDLYCAMSIFNPKIVKKCFIGNLKYIIDTPSMSGATPLLKRKRVGNFQCSIEEYEKLFDEGLQLIVEEFDRELVLQELENMFLRT